tara:strand:- start:38 stop:229 length:192 start_codon:yes stop_codon:yes gene_type:complete
MSNEKTPEQKRDAKRRPYQYSVRLDPLLAANLQHYADANHEGVTNAAIKTIISQFFKGIIHNG